MSRKQKNGGSRFECENFGNYYEEQEYVIEYFACFCLTSWTFTLVTWFFRLSLSMHLSNSQSVCVTRQCNSVLDLLLKLSFWGSNSLLSSQKVIIREIDFKNRFNFISHNDFSTSNKSFFTVDVIQAGGIKIFTLLKTIFA